MSDFLRKKNIQTVVESIANIQLTEYNIMCAYLFL